MDRAPLSLVSQAIRRGGEPLDGAVRVGFAARVGRDPGAVRVHRDTAADASARALGTVALTVGEHVLFRHGAYRPGTPAGRRLIDHELVHVLQQRGAPAAGALRLGVGGAPAEREADRLADPATPDRARVPISSEAADVVRCAGVSYELSDAPYSTVDELAAGRPESERGFYEGLNEDQRRVMGWLRRYAVEIAVEADSRGVDRRAVAGVIAWEALENVSTRMRPSRAAGGPGKVHSQTDLGQPDTRVSAPFEVEQLGLVPRRSAAEREELLQGPEGSIMYIAAIMQAMAMVAEDAGFDIRRQPDVLCWAYNADYVDTFAEHVQKKVREGQTTFDTSQERMSAWVGVNLTFLELAVSLPAEISAAPGVFTVLFATESRKPTDAAAQAEIERAAGACRVAPDGTVVSIVGHADDRGEPEYNRALSDARAMAVFEALEAVLGADAERLQFATVAKGETEPAADLPTSRRVRIEVGR